MRGISRFLYAAIIGWPVLPTFCDLVGSIAWVEGTSMQPTLNPEPTRNDIVLLKRWNKYNVSRGEIVSLISPKDPTGRCIKRIIGMEGDVLAPFGSSSKVLIPQGHIWIEGDQRATSLDSNQYGPVSLMLVEAKVTWIIWPLDRIQPLKRDISKTLSKILMGVDRV